MSSLLKLAGVLLLAAFVSADPTRQCPDSSPAQCPIDPCATVRCSAGHVCQANYCNNFPTVGAAACTASCVSSTATCPLLLGLTVGFPLRCGSGSAAFPTCTDGCNSCACQNGEFGACTERFCTTLATCTDAAGRTYESGSTIPRRLTSGADASDNSNLCVCSGYGRWVCSQLPRATVAPTPPATTQHGSCPDGSAPSQCLLDPCATWKCTATTQCVANYCDGFPTPGRGPCTASCVPLPTLTPPTVPPTGACPDGSNPVACTLNPCAVTTCLAGSECVPNYCNTGAGPCTATCVPRRTFPPLTQKPTTTRRPTTIGSGSCPDGSNPVQCTVNPCAAVLCQTGSTCVPNYCSNFPALGDVPCTAQCVAQPSPPVNTCPDGSAIAMCFQNPCANILCPATKQCVANYCNGFPTPGRAPCTATCVARP